MRVDSHTFICDARGCSAHFTTTENKHTAAYLAAAEAGWITDRALTGWKHYCGAECRDAAKAAKR